MRTLAGMAVAAAFVLTGCGGGGGNSVAVTPTPTTVSGTAAKGIVKQARVLACRIVNGVPESDVSCTTGATESDGSYTVTFVDGHTGPVMIKLMPGAASMMSDETTGTDIPYSMIMRAVIPSVSSATTAHVTPFSEMAASAASMNTMNATSINQSIAAVQAAMTTLGIDMTVTPMINLRDNGSNSAMLTAQSNMVKQLGRITMAAKNSNLLRDASGAPCNAAGTTSSQQIACAVTAMAGVMSGYATADPTKAANFVAALNAQGATNIYMAIRRPDGTISMQHADMTSYSSMQNALQNAGSTVSNAANMANAMMNGMH